MDVELKQRVEPKQRVDKNPHHNCHDFEQQILLLFQIHKNKLILNILIVMLIILIVDLYRLEILLNYYFIMQIQILLILIYLENQELLNHLLTILLFLIQMKVLFLINLKILKLVMMKVIILLVLKKITVQVNMQK